MNLKDKKLLILTGCNGSNDIIQYAKKKGVFTIATDYHTVSNVKDMADCRYDVSTTDVESLYSIAKKHSIDGITTGTSEASMYSVLELTSRLRLPFYATSYQLENINDKKLFKNLLNEHNVPVTEEISVNNIANKQELNKINYPVVVKPVDSSGRKGISSCNGACELMDAYNYALQYSRKKEVIVEKCYKGLPEVFFIYTIVDGVFSLSGAFDKYINYSQNPLIGLPIANMFPSSRINDYLKTTHNKLVSALKSIGIKNGTMSIQCFTEGEKFYVYEAGYRLGGEQMYIFTQELNGINAMEMMVNFALTGKMNDDTNYLAKDNPLFSKPCLQLNIPLKSGKISVLQGIEEVKQLNGVLNVTEVHKKGDTIKRDGTLGQLCLRIHIIARSILDMTSLINKINSTLNIKDENGKDMILERYSHKV